MKIEMGLFDHMVVQRNSRNVSEAGFSGTCAAEGVVMATVKRANAILKGFASIKVGTASGGKMTGCIKGLPVGGPYEIELKVGTEKLLVKDLLVGDVWLLGGQSNMQGCGLFPKKRLSANPLVRAFYMDDRWAVAKDPVHNMYACVDQVHVDLNGGTRPLKPDAAWGVCPGPAFASEMHRLTGVPQGMLACAHGGTSMEQWNPARKNEGGKSLYGALVRRLKKNGGRVAGMIWYQGCSDANADSAKIYTQRMKTLVSSLRSDCGDKTLPVAIVQIARVVGWGAETAVHWNSIQEQQRLLYKSIANFASVPAIDLPLDDGIHISGAGQYVLGKRLAYAMNVLRAGRKAGLPQIVPKKVTVETVRTLGVAVVQFENVIGSLRSAGRPSGFSIVNENGSSNHFDILLDGNCARIRSGLPPEMLETAMLHYGYGTDPYCNITDGAGRPLPVFGPMHMGEPRATTPFIRDFCVSPFQPSAGKLDKLGYPSKLDALKLKKCVFPANFCDMHLDIAKRGAADEVLYFACKFSCTENMRLALLLGYDGPVKVWVDKRQVFHDPNGTNPAVYSKGKAVFQVKPGEHEIIIALATNNGAAWGISARMERLDVSKQLILKGKDHYAMPLMLV